MEAGPTPAHSMWDVGPAPKPQRRQGLSPLQHRSCHLPPPLLPSSGKVWVLRRDSPWELCAGEVRVGTGQAFLLMVPATMGRLLGLPRARGHPRGLHCAWTSGSERAEAGPLPHYWGAREAPPTRAVGPCAESKGCMKGSPRRRKLGDPCGPGFVSGDSHPSLCTRTPPRCPVTNLAKVAEAGHLHAPRTCLLGASLSAPGTASLVHALQIQPHPAPGTLGRTSSRVTSFWPLASGNRL